MPATPKTSDSPAQFPQAGAVVKDGDKSYDLQHNHMTTGYIIIDAVSQKEEHNE